MGMDGFCDPAKSSWLQFSSERICLASSKLLDSSTARLSSSQRQPKVYSVVLSESFVFAPFLVPNDGVTGSVYKENAQFKQGTNLTTSDNDKSGNGCRCGVWRGQTVTMTSWMHIAVCISRSKGCSKWWNDSTFCKCMKEDGRHWTRVVEHHFG